MNIKVGNTTIKFNFAQGLDIDCLTRYLEFFIVDDDPQYEVNVIKSDDKYFDSLKLEYSKDEYYIETTKFSAQLDFNHKKGYIGLHSDPCPIAFLGAVKNFFVYIALDHGGVVLHASGVVKENKSYVFFGPSGSGKSTTVENSPDTKVLSEENIAIIPYMDSYVAYGLPYPDDTRFVHRSKDAYPLEYMFSLVQDKENSLAEPKLSRIAADMFMLPAGLSGSIWYCEFLDRFKAIVETVKCKELHLQNNSSFWDVIS